MGSRVYWFLRRLDAWLVDHPGSSVEFWLEIDGMHCLLEPDGAHGLGGAVDDAFADALTKPKPEPAQEERDG